MPTGPLRFAYLVSQFPAINHTYVLDEVRELRRLGLELHVASISPPDRPASGLSPAESEEAARIFYVKRAGLLQVLLAHLTTAFRHPAGYARGLVYPFIAGRGNWRATISWCLYFGGAVVLGAWMESRCLSHLHVHFASNVALLVSRVFPVTFSLTVHGFGELHEDPVGSRLTDKIAACSFACSVSKYGRSQLMRLCQYEDWGKVEFTPLGVDTSVFVSGPADRMPKPFEVLSVGRLSPEKGQHVLLAAVQHLVCQGRELQVRLVGDGPDRAGLERDALRRGLGGRIVFEGWLNRERLRSLYERADVLVLPSFVEGIPVVLMEAMAMEIPCVAAWITGIPELIRSGQDGVLVPPSDHFELARAIALLMDDPALRACLGRAARERVVRDFDVRRNTARLSQVFQERLK